MVPEMPIISVRSSMPNSALCAAEGKGWVAGQVDKGTDTQVMWLWGGGCMDGGVDEWVGRFVMGDGWGDGWMDGQMDKWRTAR